MTEKETVHRCPCGRIWTDAELRKLPEVGRQVLAFDASFCDCAASSSAVEADHAAGCDAHGYVMVLVNCTCHQPTTMSYYLR